ncbi:MAG TPA: hypothetical protein VF541_09295 [Longimicrobium sp.]
MEKLKLDLDAVTVETFTAAAVPMDDAGTVLAREALSGSRCSAVDACPSARGCTTISPC